jgi:hypothetical protein
VTDETSNQNDYNRDPLVQALKEWEAVPEDDSAGRLQAFKNVIKVL